jgi:hypothetical protein
MNIGGENSRRTVPIQGQCQNFFFTLSIFTKQLLLAPLDMSRKDFKFFRIFKELFVFVINSSVISTLGSQPKKTGLQKILLVQNTPGSQDSRVINTLGSLAFLDYLSTESIL